MTRKEFDSLRRDVDTLVAAGDLDGALFVVMSTLRAEVEVNELLGERKGGAPKAKRDRESPDWYSPEREQELCMKRLSGERFTPEEKSEWDRIAALAAA